MRVDVDTRSVSSGEMDDLSRALREANAAVLMSIILEAQRIETFTSELRQLLIDGQITHDECATLMGEVKKQMQALLGAHARFNRTSRQRERLHDIADKRASGGG